MSLNIVLFQPEIPANTGNIARTCAATNTSLHLIRPLGFSTDDKMLRRAGLDYWQYADVHYYDSLNEFFKENPNGDYYYITKYGTNTHTDFDYSDMAKNTYFVFGRETNGLPDDLIENNKERCLRLPMTDHVRALNLSNTAAIMVYEALRQQNYPGMK